MATPRIGLAGAAVSGKLHALGGEDGSNNPLALNEAYTPGNVWLTRSAMPTPRESFATAAVGGKLYTARPATGSPLFQRHRLSHA